MRDPPSVRTLPRSPRAGRPALRVPLVLCQEMGISQPRPSRPPPPQHRPGAPRVPGTSRLLRRGRPPHRALGAREAAGARVPRGGARRGRQWGCGGGGSAQGGGGGLAELGATGWRGWSSGVTPGSPGFHRWTIGHPAARRAPGSTSTNPLGGGRGPAPRRGFARKSQRLPPGDDTEARFGSLTGPVVLGCAIFRFCPWPFKQLSAPPGTL